MAAARSRELTPGEIALARSIFGDSIDYPRVRLVLGKFWPFHPRGMAMAPMGNIHFHPDCGGWSEDFAVEPFQLVLQCGGRFTSRLGRLRRRGRRLASFLRKWFLSHEFLSRSQGQKKVKSALPCEENACKPAPLRCQAAKSFGFTLAKNDRLSVWQWFSGSTADGSMPKWHRLDRATFLRERNLMSTSDLARQEIAATGWHALCLSPADAISH